MAKPKKNARYDLKAADRRRNLFIQIGLTAIVVLLGAGLVLYIVTSSKKPAEGEAKSIRVTSSNVITKEGTDEPKAVLSLYEDFLCPACGNFEKQFGPTVNKLIDTGAVAADYYMVSILDRQGDGYSTRASNAAYCVADESTDAFRRFHAALYAQQPEEGVGPFPDNARLIEVARQAGVGRRCPGLHQQGQLRRDGAGSREGDRCSVHPDDPHQRRGLQPHHARRAGRQDQGDRRRRSGPDACAAQPGTDPTAPAGAP